MCLQENLPPEHLAETSRGGITKIQIRRKVFPRRENFHWILEKGWKAAEKDTWISRAGQFSLQWRLLEVKTRQKHINKSWSPEHKQKSAEGPYEQMEKLQRKLNVLTRPCLVMPSGHEKALSFDWHLNGHQSTARNTNQRGERHESYNDGGLQPPACLEQWPWKRHANMSAGRSEKQGTINFDANIWAENYTRKENTNKLTGVFLCPKESNLVSYLIKREGSSNSAGRDQQRQQKEPSRTVKHYVHP